jgi:uncharacterized protein YggE
MEKQYRESKLRTIVVTGIGQASAQPNKAASVLGVSTMAATASDALNNNSKSLKNI